MLNKKRALNSQLLLITGVLFLTLSGLIAYRFAYGEAAVKSPQKLVSPLPGFLDKASPDVREAYEFALSRPDVLEHMACYCGCESIKHTSNKRCFLKQVNEDGTVEFDKHGSRCEVCVDVALTTKKMMTEGKKLREIRSILDKRYADYYKTDTPYPPE